MEVMYLSEKNRIDISLGETLENIESSSKYTVVDLNADVLRVAETINFYELHDRLILATAQWLQIPILIGRLAKIFVFSIMSTQFCAFLVATMVQLTLCPTDGAYNQTIFQTLSDPFVVTVASYVGVLSGLAAFPLCCFFLWNRDLKTAGSFVVILVSIEIIVVSLVRDANAAWLFSYIALLCALAICRYSNLGLFKLKT